MNTDGHYHLKGMATNTLPVTRSDRVFTTIEFQDKGSGTGVKTVQASIQGPIGASNNKIPQFT
ncbi:MAG: hypothetical protein WBQ25_22105 [Nitrososphaeraceae archaeon]